MKGRRSEILKRVKPLSMQFRVIPIYREYGIMQCIENNIMIGEANCLNAVMTVLLWSLFGVRMMTSSTGNIFRVTSPLCGEFAGHQWIPRIKRPVTWSFDVFFDLSLNKRLSKQSKPRWFETPSRSLWRRYNGLHSLISQTILSAPKCQSNDNLFSLIPCLTRSGNEFTIFCAIHYGTWHL